MTGSLSFNFKALSLRGEVVDEDDPAVVDDDDDEPLPVEEGPAAAVSLCSASPSELDSLGPDAKTPVFGLMRI